MNLKPLKSKRGLHILRESHRGQGMVEYAVLLALLGAAVVGAIALANQGVSTAVNNTKNDIGGSGQDFVVSTPVPLDTINNSQPTVPGRPSNTPIPSATVPSTSTGTAGPTNAPTNTIPVATNTSTVTNTPKPPTNTPTVTNTPLPTNTPTVTNTPNATQTAQYYATRTARSIATGTAKAAATQTEAARPVLNYYLNSTTGWSGTTGVTDSNGFTQPSGDASVVSNNNGIGSVPTYDLYGVAGDTISLRLDSKMSNNTGSITEVTSITDQSRSGVNMAANTFALSLSANPAVTAGTSVNANYGVNATVKLYVSIKLPANICDPAYDGDYSLQIDNDYANSTVVSNDGPINITLHCKPANVWTATPTNTAGPTSTKTSTNTPKPPTSTPTVTSTVPPTKTPTLAPTATPGPTNTIFVPNN